MKIIFIENRHKTLLWKKLADELFQYGFEIHWIVQNKFFAPKGVQVNVIPYPSLCDLCSPVKEVHLKIKMMDRGAYFFGNNGLHYEYYHKNIEAIIGQINPDLVVGESTLFHELLAIDVCKSLGVVYLNPSSCRYPVGRFSLYQYDTLKPYKENFEFEVLNEDKLLAESLSKRKLKPDYMLKPVNKLSGFTKKCKVAYNSATSFISWILGERFNTPSPIKKYLANRTVKTLKKIWEEHLVERSLDQINWSETVVFPLQMQPEANIDVWGFPYNNQLDNLKLLIKSLPEGWKVLVKPNPKVKYELTRELIDYLVCCQDVLCISHSISMDDIFENSCWFYTVTGTVGIEAVLSDKKLITHRNSFLNGYPKVYQIDNGNIYLSEEKYSKYQLISYLRSNSYSGLISDPISSNECVTEENILLISSAIRSNFAVGDRF